MARSYIQYWEWFHGFGKQAAHVGDHERTRLYEMYMPAVRNTQKYPEQALTVYREGAALARTLHEPWLEVFYENLVASVLLWNLSRYEEGLNLAMMLVAKSSHPPYSEAPTRARVLLNLIVAYIHLDGLSYVDEIRDMVESLDSEVPLDHDSHLRLLSYRAQIWHLMGDMEKTLEATHFYVEQSAGIAYRLADGYGMLCHYSYLQGDDQKALEYAHLSQTNARESYRTDEVINVYWWQATLLFLHGDLQEAERCFRLGFGEASQLERPRACYALLE